MVNDSMVAAETTIQRLRTRQRERFERAEPVRVEELLSHPLDQSLSDEETLELILSEYCLRREFGERPEVSEYVERFPKHAERLARLIALQSAMQETSDSDALGETRIVAPGAIENSLADTASRLAVNVRTDHDQKAGDVAAKPATEQKTEHSTPTPKRIGDYEIQRELARGGMGIVYRAYHSMLHAWSL